MKTLREKDKLLLTSNFSLSHNFFPFIVSINFKTFLQHQKPDRAYNHNIPMNHRNLKLLNSTVVSTRMPLQPFNT